MKPITAIFVCLMLAPVISALGQAQVETHSRGYANSESIPEFYFGGGIGRSDLDSEGFDDPMGSIIRGG